MKTLIRKSEAQITPTPEELADCWCSMDADEQAEFFNRVGLAVEGWDKPFCFQLQAIQDCPKLNHKARFVMHQIGQYS